MCQSVGKPFRVSDTLERIEVFMCEKQEKMIEIRKIALYQTLFGQVKGYFFHVLAGYGEISLHLDGLQPPKPSVSIAM